MTPDTTVYEFAVEYAHAHHLALITRGSVKPGVIVVDSEHGIVAVHPDAYLVTLIQNTQYGSLLPGAYAKP